MPNIGPLEIAIVLIIALIVFGPRKLPELGGSMGKAIRDFGHGLKGEERALDAGPVDDAEPAVADRAADHPAR